MSFTGGVGFWLALISTMSFFYWVFPYALPRMQRMSTAKRSEWIVIFYWLQLATCASILPSHLRKLLELTAAP